MKKYIYFIGILFFTDAFPFSEQLNVTLNSDNVEGIRKYSIDNLELFERDGLGLNALAYSLQYKKLEIANYLIDRKIGINVRDYLGRSPFMIACSNNLPKNIIEKLLSTGVDYTLVDKLGRNIEFYAQESDNPEIIKKISELGKLRKRLEENEINELKNIFKDQSYNELISFYNKHQTINFKENKEDLTSYLINNKLISRWNIENLIGLGLDIFGVDFPSNLITSGNGKVILELTRYKINFGGNSQGIPLIYQVLKNTKESEVILKITEKTSDFKYKDNDGNNLLHIAIQNNQLFILDFLISQKISLNELNNKKESPLILVANLTDSEIVKNIFSSNFINFSSKDEKGNDPVILLAKNHPEIFKKLQSKFFNDGYTFTNKNNENLDALSFIKENPSENNVEIPKLIKLPSKPKLNNKLNKEIISDPNIPEISNQFNDSMTASGDRLFDKFISKSLEDHLLALRQSFIQDHHLIANQKGIENTKKFESIDLKIKLVFNKLENFEKEKNEQILLLNDLKAQHLNKKPEIVFGNLENSFNLLNSKFEELKNYVNDVNVDFQNYNEQKELLENKIKLLKIGKDEYSTEINELKGQIPKVREELSYFNKLAESERDASLSFLKIEVITDQKNREDSLRKLNNAQSIISNSQYQIQMNLILIQQNNAAIVDPSHDHNEPMCKFSAKIKELESNNNTLKNTIKENESNIKNLTDSYLKDKASLEKSKDALSKEKASKEKEYNDLVTKNKNVATSTEKELQAQINNLEKVKSIELKDLADKSRNLLSYIESKYGEPDLLSQSWDIIYSTTSKISASGFKELITHGWGGIVVYSNPDFVENLSKTKLGKKYLEITDSVIPAYKTHVAVGEKYSEFNDNYSKTLDTKKLIEKINSDIETEKLNMENLQEEKDALALGLLNHLSEDEFDNLLNAHEVLYLTNQGDRQPILDKISSISSKLKIENIKYYQQYLTPFKLIPTEVQFNGLDLDDLKVGSEISKESVPFVLAAWYNLLLKEDFFGSLSSLNSQNLFINTLSNKVKVFKVKDFHESSIMISTPFGKFIIGENGHPTNIELEESSDNYFDFELTSTGRVKEEVKRTLKLLADTYATNDLGLIKESFDISFMINLLKLADKINNVDQSLEIINMIRLTILPAAKLTPYGNSVSLLLGLPECALRLYKKNVLNVRGSFYGDYQTAWGCFSEIITPPVNFIAEFTAEKLMRKLFDIILPKNGLSVQGKKFVLEYIEVFTGITLDKLNEDIFEKFSPETDKIFSTLMAIKKVELINESSSLLIGDKNIKIIKGKITNDLNEEYFSLQNGTNILNLCSLQKNDFIKELIKYLPLDSAKDINSSNFVSLKKGTEIFSIGGSACLHVKP